MVSTNLGQLGTASNHLAAPNCTGARFGEQGGREGFPREVITELRTKAK